MTRKPFTHTGLEGYRIASMPNGAWQVQRKHGDGARERDPWKGEHRATDLATAKGQLLAIAAKQQAKGEIVQ